MRNIAMTLETKLRTTIRDVADFPKQGILFKDITPVLADARLRHDVVSTIVANFQSHQIEAVAGIEARGFILGSLLAERLHVPFVPIRKAGKLPFKTVREAYDLEYGSAAIEVHQDAFRPGQRVLLHDDLLATGGTARAAGRLIRHLGAELVGFSFIINLSFLPGEQIVKDNFGISPFCLVSYGE
jgi:adenine phosphoribosyltransferase